MCEQYIIIRSVRTRPISRALYNIIILLVQEWGVHARPRDFLFVAKTRFRPGRVQISMHPTHTLTGFIPAFGGSTAVVYIIRILSRTADRSTHVKRCIMYRETTVEKGAAVDSQRCSGPTVDYSTTRSENLLGWKPVKIALFEFTNNYVVLYCYVNVHRAAEGLILLLYPYYKPVSRSTRCVGAAWTDLPDYKV